MPSRKQRRVMARKFGLVKKDISFKDWSQQLERSVSAGQAIHRNNLQEMHNNRLKEKSEITEIIPITEETPELDETNKNN